MKIKTIILIFTFVGLNSCKLNNQGNIKVIPEKQSYSEVISDNFELYKPNKKCEAVLILFGGFGQQPKDIKREFTIIGIAKENNIAVLLMNYKSQLWLSKKEKNELASSLQHIIGDNQLPTNNIYIGGFSSGGIFSLLVSDYIMASEKFDIKPKGVFAIDSPVDLAGTYEYCKNSIGRNHSEISVRESKYLLDLLESNLGNPVENIQNYQDRSVFTLSNNNSSNVKNLKNTKIRLYSEPDLNWWKINRNMNYEDLNAYYIKGLTESMRNNGFKNVEYIQTENKGYKSNGERHPHSWSIVDKNNLIKWILNN